jgi:hypothetical protein
MYTNSRQDDVRRPIIWSGSYTAMSSILPDQERPRILAQMRKWGGGGGGVAGDTQ